MDFNETINTLEKKIHGCLPGMEAHKLMLPQKRILKRTEELNTAQKLSSVLILLYEKNSRPYSVLIIRNTYKGIHSGQIGLPGGKFEKNDSDLIQTALRESSEEIGLPKENVKVLGTLTPIFIPPSMFWVMPVVGVCDSAPQFIPDTNEVAGIIEYDVSELLKNDNIQEKVFEGHNYHIEAPYFNINGQSVWGATAMILSELKWLLERD